MEVEIALSGPGMKHGLHAFSKWRSTVRCRDLNVLEDGINSSSSIEKRSEGKKKGVHKTAE